MINQFKNFKFEKTQFFSICFLLCWILVLIIFVVGFSGWAVANWFGVLPVRMAVSSKVLPVIALFGPLQLSERSVSVSLIFFHHFPPHPWFFQKWGRFSLPTSFSNRFLPTLFNRWGLSSVFKFVNRGALCRLHWSGQGFSHRRFSPSWLSFFGIGKSSCLFYNSFSFSFLRDSPLSGKNCFSKRLVYSGCKFWV